MRELEALKGKLKWAIANLKRCYVGDNTLDISKLKDDFMFRLSTTYVNQSVEAGLTTHEEFNRQIADGFVPNPIETKEEAETCSQ